ncbi:hypothetical protein IVB45_18510 [Bradyrhizobium sp. 4]|uniref:hypothetical protein n=1 Tax=unclassified Bradyrhizobium TaxID=2631580 RepID=UPI001FFBA838|nr:MULTISPECIES: hypothetical protein [unclassified Bradyrhizobium]MCK1400115.1 hypothetical protein [Bradyrhizobium sp. 39]MCK1750405.1 hypothetical protein [Bradyrhizobium sp. 135]UPJ32014.1 hypothetical protein IVB45_18510 [Bradyrhizobium sp. 4]
MSTALTLTEAAERLAPVFAEETGTSSALVSSPKGKWLSLDDAAAVLSGRVAGQRAAPRKKRAEVTVHQAAGQIDRPYADLAEVRQTRYAATGKQLRCLSEMNDFIDRAVQQFQGVDDMTVLHSPEFQASYAYAQGLKTIYEAACGEELQAWKRQCDAENDAFSIDRPDWGREETAKVVAMLKSMGSNEHELQQLWSSPTPINLSSPACLAIAQKATGIDGWEAIPAALAAVGFSDNEIQAALSGAPVLLRDHRIQELVARAADADTPAEDREAA